MTAGTARALVAETLHTVLEAVQAGSLESAESRIDAIVAKHTSPTARPATICKVDPERRMVYGWASVATVHGAPLVDRQQDVIAVDDLRDAAHDFMKRRVLNRMHEAHPTADIGDIRESIIFDKGLQDALGIDLGCEGWFVGAHVRDDATWARVRSGELRSFSIEGSGSREPLAKRARSQVDRTPERHPESGALLFADVKKLTPGDVHMPGIARARVPKKKKPAPKSNADLVPTKPRGYLAFPTRMKPPQHPWTP